MTSHNHTSKILLKIIFERVAEMIAVQLRWEILGIETAV